MMEQSKTIPSLYGLRAISILLVIVSHCFLRAKPSGSVTRILLALAGNGAVGVSIFFVISGFLITVLLLRERDRFGRVHIGDFYLRRLFRILPAFFVYVGTVAVLVHTGMLAIPVRQFWHALTFTMDYVIDKNWFLAHAWSLSVEEQFYLLWPLLVVLCSRRTLTIIASGVILLGPFIRIADRIFLPATKFEIEYMGHTRADMLMFGCLIALWFESARLYSALKKTNSLLVPALSAVFLFIVSPLLELRFGGPYIKTIGYTLQGISISFMLLYLVIHPQSIAGRGFNSKLAVHVGVISYSLYLWQELFIGFRQFGFGNTLLRVAASVLAAEASYVLVESPMLGLKRRFSLKRIGPLVPERMKSAQIPLDPELHRAAPTS